MSTQSHKSTEHRAIEDAIKLFTYLRELVRLRWKSTKSLDEYERVLWLNSLPREPECYTSAWPDQEEIRDDVWIQVDKPSPKPPPRVPDEAKDWVDPSQVADSSLELPELKNAIEERVPNEPEEGLSPDWDTVTRDLTDFPEIERIWDDYVQENWWPWAEEDRRAQAIQSVYNELFTMHQRQERLGETYDVVLGLGCLSWKPPSGGEVKRHMIVAQVSLSFEPRRGVITVGPAAEGANPVLERDMLDLQDLPNESAVERVEEQVKMLPDDILGSPDASTALKELVHSISPDGKFEEDLEPPVRATEKPLLRLAPALIIRRRSERSTLKIYEEILSDMQEGTDLPAGVEQLVSIMEKPDPNDFDSGEGAGSNSEGDEEIYYPLPANDEQRLVARKLAVSDGVLVQGPPGTGKSWTIANLICHLLALGKRVLVTSHTARALEVLKDDLPEEVRNLCVQLLGNDRAALQSMEDSVQGISDRFNAWTKEASDREIRDVEERLDRVRREMSLKSRELQESRATEVTEQSLGFGGYEGTKQKIARQLRAQTSQFGWMVDRPGREMESPITNAEALELLGLLNDISDEHERTLLKEIPGAGSLATSTTFEGLVANESRLVVRLGTAEDGHQDHSEFHELSREALQGLNREVDDVIQTYRGLEGHIQKSWVTEAARQILGDRDRAWRSLFEITSQRLDEIEPLAAKVSGWTTSGIDLDSLTVLRANGEALRDHLRRGGGLGWGPIRPTVVRRGRYILEEVLIDGRHCDSVDSIGDLLDWIAVIQALELIDEDWRTRTAVPTGALHSRVAEYRDLCEPLEISLSLHDKAEKIRTTIAEYKLEGIPAWNEPSQIAAFGATIRRRLDVVDLSEVRISIGRIQAEVDRVSRLNEPHHLVNELSEALRARDTRHYEEVLEEFAQLRADATRLSYRNDLQRRLSEKAERVSEFLARTHDDPAWQKHLEDFVGAWDWARATGWILRLESEQLYDTITNELNLLGRQEETCLKSLVSHKAWAHCCSRLTEEQRQALQAWSLAVRRVGKGTGKYAPMHRREARRHLDASRSAIPGWIMPIYRVAETIRPGQDRFDVIIVDEASQSGNDALFLSYLAKKLIVVGDDQQISPDYVGQNRQQVEDLRVRHIPELQFGDALGVDSSFFDQAVIRYPGRIRLREHFRCMPEIIQFSNNLAYASEPLIPIRQYGAGRLTPVVKTHFVADGYEKGDRKKVNPPEAEALVNQLVACCSDPAYEGKTMGVISLLGPHQARLIEQSLLKELGPEVISNRKIHCGDAYDFQGAQRDVIFLSMVRAPSSGRIQALGQAADKRRFNVAASRARDQMWLFHSAQPSDLNPRDLRHMLLSYCLNPKVEQSPVEGLDVSQLSSAASTADRGSEDAPQPFDSWFEVDVFLKIVGRGYRVLPQYHFAGRNIDLMVEGMKGRLAVECDGDRWHGPDRYESDMARQRELERAGLQFWRVRGSGFELDPDGALEPLWALLSQLKIHPEMAESGQEEVLAQTAENPQLDQMQTGDRREVFEDSGSLSVPAVELTDQAQNILSGFASDISNDSEFDEYREFGSRPVIDPRKATQSTVMGTLVQIVEVEGPIFARRAYQIYAHMADISRVRNQLRTNFDNAISRAISEGTLDSADEMGTGTIENLVLRTPGQPEVWLRSQGSRNFYEIPPREISSLASILKARGFSGRERLYPEVLHHYGLGRLTSKARRVLDLSLRDLLDSTE